MTPADVHFGRAPQVLQQRAETLKAAYQAHPLRFSRPPVPQALPDAVWINPPERQTNTASLIPALQLSQSA